MLIETIVTLFISLSSALGNFWAFCCRLDIILFLRRKSEHMVRYYGHHCMKQFIHGKPIRYGFKQWAMCCEEAGYCFHFELYEGKTEADFPVEGFGASVILKNISPVGMHQFQSPTGWPVRLVPSPDWVTGPTGTQPRLGLPYFKIHKFFLAVQSRSTLLS